jgi:TatD DNase family protein
LQNICSLGLHPWFIEIPWQDSWQNSWQNLENLSQLSQVIAIGECGLDRNCKLPIALQTVIFQNQIQLAERLRKPLVIHCVKAFSELIALKKQTKPVMPWIIHGFHKKASVYQLLLDHGFYFSFGAAILQDQAFVTEAIATMPIGKFLLETDDRQDLQIEQIYERTAQLRKVSISTLEIELLETYQQLTGLV